MLARIPLPVSGFLTVTENVMVAAAPAARFPVQVRFGLVKVGTLPGRRGGIRPLSLACMGAVGAAWWD